jgi:hypothetical protein
MAIVFGQSAWKGLRGGTAAEPPCSLHLAVFVEPYLQYVLQGTKTVESRFSLRRCAPYGRVRPGDVMLLKRSGGPIVGLCAVANVWLYHLDPASWQFIRREFTQALCAQDPAFWQQRERANFATLLRVENARTIPPLAFPKRDRRGWVVVRDGAAKPLSTQQSLL